MPRHARRRPRGRRNLRRRGPRRARVNRPLPSMGGVGNYATVIESRDFGTILGNAGQLSTFTLGMFQRAQQMAGLFQWYRAKKVTWSYEPLFNTFQEGVGASGSPYLLTLMNRAQEAISNTYVKLLSAGVRPVKLTEKKTISYKPNWCSPGLQALVANFSTGDLSNMQSLGLKPEFGWLATPYVSQSIPGDQTGNYIINDTTTPFQPVQGLYNNITYNGHITYINQDGAVQQPICRLICQVEWQFKGAKNNMAQAPPSVAVDAPVGASA